MTNILRFLVVHNQHLNLDLAAQINSSAFVVLNFLIFSFGNQKLKTEKWQFKQRRVQDFPGGANSKCENTNLLLGQIFPESCMNMKLNRGGASLATSADPPLVRKDLDVESDLLLRNMYCMFSIQLEN